MSKRIVVCAGVVAMPAMLFLSSFAAMAGGLTGLPAASAGQPAVALPVAPAPAAALPSMPHFSVPASAIAATVSDLTAQNAALPGLNGLTDSGTGTVKAAARPGIRPIRGPGNISLPIPGFPSLEVPLAVPEHG